MKGSVEMAFLLTILAGLSTGIGSLIAFFIRDNKNTRYLSISMGFAAGVMLYVSFMEILPEAIEELEGMYRNTHDMGSLFGVLAFFGGMMLVAGIDKLIPHRENPHELMSKTEIAEGETELAAHHRHRLMRIGFLTAVALALHNFPEGIATFVSTLEDEKLGIAIAIAIALHNIPEGVAVSMPIYYATGSKGKAFMYSFLSGLVEPVGAIVCYLIFGQYLNPLYMSLLLAAVAGIMVYISLDQLLPAAEEYGEHHLTIYGVVAGMAVMALSLVMVMHEH